LDYRIGALIYQHDLSRFRSVARGSAAFAWYWSRMTDVLMYAMVPLALAVVAVILLFGFINFARGGSPHTSQKLMRWRVLMQFVALVVIMITIWVMGR
jgi:hypoxia induced protein